jgi:O-acetyl-ADP-ribose deacetylase (regulator of RNase III)
MHSFIVKKGDLLKSANDYQAIAQGCNCFSTMGGGIALSIKKMFPEAYEADRHLNLTPIERLGNFSFTCIKTDESFSSHLYIYNLYSQFGHNPMDKPLDYEALTLALRKMAHNLKENGLTKIGLPLIGFGLAGGKLELIVPIMYRELFDFEVELVVFEGDAGVDDTVQTASGIIKVLEGNTALNKYIEMIKVKMSAKF